MELESREVSGLGGDLNKTFQSFIKGDLSAVLSVEGVVEPQHRYALTRGMPSVKVCIQPYIMTALGLMVSWVSIFVITESYLIKAVSLVMAHVSAVYLWMSISTN